MSCDRRGVFEKRGLRTHEQPLPSLHALDSAELKDARCQDGAQGVAAEHAEEEDGHALGELSPGIPRRESVDGAGDIARFGEAENQARGQEAAAVDDQELEHGHQPEDEDLARDPFSGAELPKEVSEGVQVETQRRGGAR